MCRSNCSTTPSRLEAFPSVKSWMFLFNSLSFDLPLNGLRRFELSGASVANPADTATTDSHGLEGELMQKTTKKMVENDAISEKRVN